MIVRIWKLSDGELLDVLKVLFGLFPDGNASAVVAEGVARRFDSADSVDEYEFDRTAKNIQTFTFACQRVEPDTVVFQRGTTDVDFLRQHGPMSAFSRRVPSAYFDEFGFFGAPTRSGNYQPLTDDQRVAVSELLNSHAAAAEASDDEDARKLSRLITKQIDDLRKLNLQMTQGLADARKRDEEAFQTRLIDLDESFKNRLAELTEKESELERRRTELNDREPQHERRRLREHLTERLQKTIAEPPKAATSREWSSNAFYLIVALVFVGFSVFLAATSDLSQTATGTGSAAFWARSLKSLVSGIAGAAFAWAGLAGLKSSARAAREYEQEMQRYAFDMDRASWVVETLLQMNAIETAQVPEEWLEAVCRDLFIVSPRAKEEPGSLEAFAALFDATARARFGTNGVEFEIDRKRAKQLAAQAG